MPFGMYIFPGKFSFERNKLHRYAIMLYLVFLVCSVKKSRAQAKSNYKWNFKYKFQFHITQCLISFRLWLPALSYVVCMNSFTSTSVDGAVFALTLTLAQTNKTHRHIHTASNHLETFGTAVRYRMVGSFRARF